MENGKPFTQIDKTVDLPPLQIGSRSVRPIARLKGWYVAAGKKDNGGAGAALRLTPTEVEVQEGENRTSLASTSIVATSTVVEMYE